MRNRFLQFFRSIAGDGGNAVTMLMAAAFIAAGCAPTLHEGRMYDGPARSGSEICMITPAGAQTGGVRIIRIGGQSVKIEPPQTVELLPGTYSLEVMFDGQFFRTGYRERLHSDAVKRLDLLCEGGHVSLLNYSLEYTATLDGWEWQPFLEDITLRNDVQKFLEKREDALRQSVEN